MDALVKWLGADYPVHQLVFFRCVVALVPVCIVLYMSGGLKLLKTQRPQLHLLRSTIGLLAMGAAFYGFTTLPLAEAASIFYMAPLFSVVFSTVLLKEKVGVRRWSAVLIGMLGVIIIIRPSGDIFNFGSVVMLAASLLIGFASCVLRLMSKTEYAVTTTFYFTLSGAVIVSVICLFLGWVTPNPFDLLLLICVGLLGGMAQYELALSLRYAEVGVLSPFRYLSIAIGGFFGFVIWQEVPDMLTIIGIVTIVVSGIYSTLRESRLAAQNATSSHRKITQGSDLDDTR